MPARPPQGNPKEPAGHAATTGALGASTLKPDVKSRQSSAETKDSVDSHSRQACRIPVMEIETDQLQIGAFAELVGLSVPQLRRYDRLRLLEPAGRSASSGYRYYTRGQSGAARVIALLRSMDMPISEIRRILSGTADSERRSIFKDHRSRLEARLDEVRRLLEAVDALAEEDSMNTETGVSSWLHLMPRIPVTDMERSLTYYQEVLDFHANWHTPNGNAFCLASGAIELLMLTTWTGEGAPPPQSAYVFVEDPDSLCAEYQQAGADIVQTVDTRPYGMRDFTVRDPDGNTFTLGRGTEKLRELAEQYGLTPDTISVNPVPEQYKRKQS